MLRRALKVRPWVWLWLPPALLLLPNLATPANWHAAPGLFGQLLLGFIAALVLRFPRSALRILLATVLALFVVSGLVAWNLSRYTWSRATNIALLSTLRQQKSEVIHDAGARKWRVPPGAALELSFDARLISGRTGWDWIRSDPNFKLKPIEKDGALFTRVTTPLGKDPYLMRTFDTGEPTGGHVFKVTLEMRSPEPIPTRGCRGMWLQVWDEGGGRKCLAVNLGPQWKTFTLTWTVPQQATSPIIRVVLNDFDGLSYDVRGVRLYEQAGQGWQKLAPLIPEGAYVQVGGPSQAQSDVGFLPTSHWQHFSFPLQNPHSSIVTVAMHATTSPGNPFAFAIRNTRLTASKSPSPQPVPITPLFHTRQSLTFGQPNLAGHTTTSIGLAALSAIHTGWLGLIISALTIFTIYLTGSRAAWIAALIGLPWLLWLVCRRRERWWVFGILIAAAVAFFILFGADTLGRLQLLNTEGINPVSRPEIWRTALQAFSSHFWTGIGADAFPAYWQAQHPGTEVITHAHDLWLQFASSYGIFGLLAILWLTGGFVTLAWRWGRWRGLGLVLPILLMNVFDYTFFYAGVLFPLILGMNALRGDAVTARRDSAGAYDDTSREV